MNEIIWERWTSDINWILDVAKRKNWDYSPLVIKKPVSVKAFNLLEKELKLEYPTDFKRVLTQYASGLAMSWQIEGEETEEEGEFSEMFCGGGRGYLWDFDTLKDDFIGYQSWVKECFPNTKDEYDKIWHGKTPFLDVPNGDVIAFCKKTAKGNPVVYLSHDGDEFHGQILGENFIDFINKWTQLGCIGTECWQFEPFYDFAKKTLLADKEKLNRWKLWLEK